MDQATAMIVASMLVSVAVALVWLHAPLLPALIGALGAGALYYRRGR